MKLVTQESMELKVPLLFSNSVATHHTSFLRPSKAVFWSHLIIAVDVNNGPLLFSTFRGNYKLFRH